MADAIGRLRIAIVASHPVQYQAPWFRALAGLVDLQVYFAHRAAPAEQARAGFGVAFDWDVPLLDGYASAWLTNVAARPGVDRFFGCNTPGIGAVLGPGRFDAVVVTGWNLLAYWQAVRAARRVRIPVLVRGDSQLGTTRKAVVRVGKRLVYPRLLRAFDGCLAVGTRNEEYYREYGVTGRRLFRAVHCVDNEYFARGSEQALRDRAAVRRTFGLAADAVVFALVAKLIPEKRAVDFLRALDRVHAAGGRVQGLIVGDGPLRAEVHDHIRRCSTPAIVAGFVNQSRMPAAYAAADAIVLPSVSETWGLAVNEAMACGVPAIVSDRVGCAPDLVMNGTTGFTYPCGDVAALADRMTAVASDPRLRTSLGERSRLHIRSFSPAATAAGVAQAVGTLCSATATAA